MMGRGGKTRPMPDQASQESLKVLSFPHPYAGMLAINSDVEFTTWDTQMALMSLCGNLGLETAFSFWCFGDGKYTWRLFEEDNSLSPQAEMAFYLAREGFLDTLHSFGGAVHGSGTVIDRNRIQLAYDVLRKEGVQIQIYSNHGTKQDRQNIGGDWAVYQEGDLPSSSFYHLDVTLNYGIRFFWTDIDYDNVWHETAPAGPTEGGHSLFATQLCRDGNRILRFKRHRGNLKFSPYAHNLAEQLHPVLQEGLHGYAVIYQHLGIHRTPDGKVIGGTAPQFRDADLAALRDLASLDRSGRILITTTKKLLRHAMVMQSRCWKVSAGEKVVEVQFPETVTWEGLRFDLNWDDLQGWCAEQRYDGPVFVSLGREKRELSAWEVGGVRYVGLPWRRLELQASLEKALASGRPGHS